MPWQDEQTHALTLSGREGASSIYVKKTSGRLEAWAMKVVNSRHYDIVRRENQGRLLWLGDVEDLENAKSRIKKLASFWPGEFAVLDQQTHRVLAEVVISPDAEPGKQ